MMLLILQIALVLAVCHLCGWAATKLGQARVIGEIAGGIVMGPSVFERIVPGISATLFPASSLGIFDGLSTVGLVLFLFLIGSELDYEQLRSEKTAATRVSVMSMAVPFGLSAAVAPAVMRRFAPAGVGETPFLLFLGISMSITALPVLARILQERTMLSTPLGSMAIVCAAVNDVCAWSLLVVAMVLTTAGANVAGLLHRLLGLGIYLAVMLLVVRPLGTWFSRRRQDRAASYELWAVTMVMVFASAAATDAIGIHPLFGAFMAGLCFPRIKSWQEALRARLDFAVSIVLLPLFFALTGMRTRLDLLHGASIWGWTGALLLLAVAGKLGGAMAAARWGGHDWRYCASLGVLLNTRGLVELVVLNIAYKAGVFSPTLFTMLVIMALVTTMMTTPLLNRLGGGKPALSAGS
jgi:Kef-type K+ transport system membrane component KefB